MQDILQQTFPNEMTIFFFGWGYIEKYFYSVLHYLWKIFIRDQRILLSFVMVDKLEYLLCYYHRSANLYLAWLVFSSWAFPQFSFQTRITLWHWMSVHLYIFRKHKFSMTLNFPSDVNFMTKLIPWFCWSYI
jgi:hypothetical protein